MAHWRLRLCRERTWSTAVGPSFRHRRMGDGLWHQRAREKPADTVAREIKEETGIDAVVTDLVAVTSSNKVLTYANGDNTMYMDHLFICRPEARRQCGAVRRRRGKPERRLVHLDDLPTPLAASTSERQELFHTYIENKKHGDAHALFQFDGQHVLADIKLAPV